MNTKLRKFDAAAYLNTEPRRRAYLETAMASGDAAFARDALGIVVRAHGMTKIAELAGINRVSLYKALGKTGNPEFSTVLGILHAMGLALSVKDIKHRKRKQRPRVTALAGKAARTATRVDA